VSNINPQDSNHPAAKAWVDRHLQSGGILIAPLLLVTETAAAVARGTRNRQAGRMSAAQLYRVAQMRLVPVDQALVDEATDLAVTYFLRGADAYYVAIARMLNVPLVTFDSEQLTRPVGVVTAIKP
jgi:predicted nucleic acid-binding protein